MLRFGRGMSTLGAAIAGIVGSLASVPALVAQHGWIAETTHFRVVVRNASGLDEAVAAMAAADLESILSALQLAGLGPPRRADGPLDILVVPHRLELHALLGDPPTSLTRGITIRGLDRDYIVVPWHEFPGPRVILAHEYLHQLDGPGWPPWFSEGRAVYVARRTEPRPTADPLAGLVAMLDRSEWVPWSELISAERDGPATRAELFQAQSWLLVHWLASRVPSVARLSPQYADMVLADLGIESLDATLRQHLAQVRELPSNWLVPLAATESWPEARAAAEWEVPLFEAEAQTALQMLDESEETLSGLADRFPRQARVQAANATLHLIRGRQDLAEKRFGAALRLGDLRARTAYRYAILLMRPGTVPLKRAEDALRYALRAREQLPQVPAHHLAVVHARMLGEDWCGAFSDLRSLLAFPGWDRRADREALEIRRRIAQSVRAVPAPTVAAPDPSVEVSAAGPPDLPAWKEPPEDLQRTAVRNRWPPYGTWLVHGRIAWVNCVDGDKTVVLHSPYQRLVLRENPDRPARLINRPFRARTLPCDSRGWFVSIAYRKLSDPGEVRGEIVGIRF